MLLGDPLVGRAEDDLLHLRELVHAVEAARVLAVRARLAAKARRDARVLERAGAASSSTSSQCMLTSGTSLVPMRKSSSAGIEYASSRPSGKNPVPVIARSFTITGGDDQLQPALDERVDRQAQHRHLEERAVAHERVRALPPANLPRPVPTRPCRARS